MSGRSWRDERQAQLANLVNPRASAFLPSSKQEITLGRASILSTIEKLEGKAHEMVGINKKSVKYLTCFYWYHGGCKKTEQECAYSHSDTGIYADKPRPVNKGGPSFAGKNLNQHLSSDTKSPSWRLYTPRSVSSLASEVVPSLPHESTPDYITTTRHRLNPRNNPWQNPYKAIASPIPIHSYAELHSADKTPANLAVKSVKRSPPPPEFELPSHIESPRDSNSRNLADYAAIFAKQKTDDGVKAVKAAAEKNKYEKPVFEPGSSAIKQCNFPSLIVHGTASSPSPTNSRIFTTKATYPSVENASEKESKPEGEECLETITKLKENSIGEGSPSSCCSGMSTRERRLTVGANRPSPFPSGEGSAEESALGSLAAEMIAVAEKEAEEKNVDIEAVLAVATQLSTTTLSSLDTLYTCSMQLNNLALRGGTTTDLCRVRELVADVYASMRQGHVDAREILRGSAGGERWYERIFRHNVD